jgi:leucyl-tRNA synthetase
LYELCVESYGRGSLETRAADKWMESTLHMIIRDATAFMDGSLFRSALQKIFFDLPKAMRQYLRKASGKSNKHVMDAAIEAQVIMLSPFAPFIAEELWHSMGKKRFVSHAAWPRYEASKIDEKATFIDDMISDTRKDIDAVLALAKISQPKKVTLLIAPQWKYDFAFRVKKHLENTRDVGSILKEIMSSPLKQHGADITKLLPRVVANPSSLPIVVLSEKEELAAFEEARKLYADELRCTIAIEPASSSSHQKAKQAMPGKPAIVVE